jgi:plastocyanin
VPGDIEIIDFGYTPANLTVDEGTPVTWANNGVAPHTVTATSGEFDSGTLNSGQTYSRTFATAGTFNYYCTIHPEMVGTITVLGADGTAPPPDPEPPAPPPPPPASGDVEMFDYAFSPVVLTVGVGAIVTWANNGVAPHTATANNGAFDSGVLSAGQTWSRTFTAAGTFNYYCTIHPEMVGTITVLGADGTAPPPDADPDPEPPPAATPVPTSGDIDMVDFGYSPSSITVAAGSTITWANNGAAPHTVTARSGSFDSGIRQPGGRYSRTFSEPGTYNYYCTLHPQMTGTIAVLDASGNAPPPTDEEVIGTAAQPTSGDVKMVDNAFQPRSLTVAAGSTITWANNGAAPHTVTARNGSFDSGLRMPGEGYTRTFDEPGTYTYFCSIHPEMTGTIAVLDASGVAPPPVGEEEVEAEGASALAGGPTPEGAFVDVVDLAFEPGEITVGVGAEVLWRFVGALPHTVTADDGSFDSGIVESGGTFARTFEELGTFSYVCTLHPNMVGVVRVVAPDDPALAAAGPLSQAGLVPGDLPSSPLFPRESGTNAIAVVGLVAALIGIPLILLLGLWVTRPKEN